MSVISLEAKGRTTVMVTVFLTPRYDATPFRPLLSHLGFELGEDTKQAKGSSPV